MSLDEDLLAYMDASDLAARGAVVGDGKTVLVKRPWTPEEDEALVAAVHKYGAARWSMIATHLSTGRVGKQCRERWNKHLCPGVKKTEWSEEEDRAILEGVAEMGTRWCDIVKVTALQGRTDNAIKNRFYQLQRRMRSRQLAAAKPSSPLGKRTLEEGGGAGKVSQRDKIVMVATQLAFTTDEWERDRLIAELCSALQSDDLDADVDPLGLAPLTAEFPKDEESEEEETVSTSSALAPSAPADPLGATAGGIRRPTKLEPLDTFRDLSAASGHALPSPSPVGAERLLSPRASHVSDSDILSIADTILAPDGLSRSASSSSSNSPTSTAPYHASPAAYAAAQSSTPSGNGSAKKRFHSSWGEKENAGPASAQRKSLEQLAEAEASALSLGGKFAHKALLPQLTIPACAGDVVPISSPAKRLRTPTGVGRAASRAAACGTEEPAAAASASDACSLPFDGLSAADLQQDELLNLDFFNDLFTDSLPAPPPSLGQPALVESL